MAPPNKIVILITGDPADVVRDAKGDYARIIANAVGGAWTGEYEACDARSADLPAVDSIFAVIISGSAANLHERAPWMIKTEQWLRDAVEHGTPVLGLCFGHQLLAQALGGEVAPNPRGREIGTVPVTVVVDDPLFEGIEPTFTANQCHSDTVVRAPIGAATLAHSSGDDHQSLRFGPRCYGVQFHPEFDGEIIRMFIDVRSEAMVDEGLDPAATRAAAKDTPVAQRVLANFVGMVTSEIDRSL